jgi:hypothetical protein
MNKGDSRVIDGKMPRVKIPLGIFISHRAAAKSQNKKGLVMKPNPTSFPS